MAICMHQPTMLFLIVSLSIFCFATSQSLVGVTYGTFGINMPAVADVANFLSNSTYIQNVRLFDMDRNAIKPMAAANINLMIGTSDNNFVRILTDIPDVANDWVKKYIVPWADKIDIFAFGNQVIGSGDSENVKRLVLAMRLMQNALNAVNLKRIKVSTINSMSSVLARDDPPSNASFNPAFYGPIHELLDFLRENNSPFLTTNYPYYGFQLDPTPDNLAYCLFESDTGRIDPVTGLKYWNMFDAKVDAVRNALDGFQFPDIEIVVAETGWPTWGDDNEVGANIENARLYNANLVYHLRTMSGTPMMPKRVVNAYIHSLFDENRKDGRGSNKAFGLLNYDFSRKYDNGLFKERGD